MSSVTSVVFNFNQQYRVEGKILPGFPSQAECRAPPLLHTAGRSARSAAPLCCSARPTHRGAEAGTRCPAPGTAFPGALREALAFPNEAQAPPPWAPTRFWQDRPNPTGAQISPAPRDGVTSASSAGFQEARTCACAEQSRGQLWLLATRRVSAVKPWGVGSESAPSGKPSCLSLLLCSRSWQHHWK